MTLVLAIPTSTGTVFASDGQVTSGEVRSSGKKLFKLNQHCAWAASGEVALIQRVSEEIGKLSVDQPLSDLRDNLANVVKQSVNALLQLDFRTQFFQGNPQGMLSLHPGDFIFVEFRDTTKILHVTSYGTPEWIEHPFATGNGANFAYALLKKYDGAELDLEKAGILAFKVIEEAIDVGAYGLGPPIFVWHVRKGGIQEIDEAGIAALDDAAKILRDGELQLLLGTSSDTDTVSASSFAGDQKR